MILVELSIQRYSELWGGVNPETVKRYQEELEQTKEEIRNYACERILFVSQDLRDSLISAINQEILYCRFYDEYLQRRADKKLDRWVFRKQEDIPDLYGWKKAPGEQWVKTNGRVRATIQFDRTGIMVKITLTYDNESAVLNFYERGYKHQDPVARLKNERSIEIAVKQFKQDADHFLGEHLFPGGSYSDFGVLQELLHISK